MPSLAWLDAAIVTNLLNGQNMTIERLVEYLRQLYPNQRGLSVRNVKYFLSQNGVCQPRVSDPSLDAAVGQSSSEVGGSYGRKMMKGYLMSQGVKASEKRIGRSLERVYPYYHANRTRGIQNQLNPIPYVAPYFGYNLHFDQNEKLVLYGVVFVIAVDGKSAYITAGATMPRKNNAVIYERVFAPSAANFGMWDSVLCDHGKEFFLIEFIQHYLSPHRVNAVGQSSQRDPYKQMPSTSVSNLSIYTQYKYRDIVMCVLVVDVGMYSRPSIIGSAIIERFGNWNDLEKHFHSIPLCFVHILV